MTPDKEQTMGGEWSDEGWSERPAHEREPMVLADLSRAIDRLRANLRQIKSMDPPMTHRFESVGRQLDRVLRRLRTDPDGSEGRELDDKFLACPKCRSALYRCGTYGDSGRPGTLTMCSECPWRGVLIDDMDTIERSGDPDREPVAWRWRWEDHRGRMTPWKYEEHQPDVGAPKVEIQPLYAPKEEGDG